MLLFIITAIMPHLKSDMGPPPQPIIEPTPATENEYDPSGRVKTYPGLPRGHTLA